MVTSQQCFAKYGNPNNIEDQNKNFELWIVSNEIREAFKHVRFTVLGTLGFPKKIFLNKDFKPVLERGLNNLIERKLTLEMKTWDGVFSIRKKIGLKSWSLHSWAIACDVNASENQLNMIPKLSKEFVACFTDAGCDWGGTWTRIDGMHFQLKKI